MATVPIPSKTIKPPYGVIWDHMKIGQVVPVLGAGASLVGRAPGAHWTPAAAFLPSGSDLAEFLAAHSSYPEAPDDLAKVASYYSDVAKRPALRRKLRELLTGTYQPGPLHKFLASLDKPQVIVVTNYDTLVEQAFEKIDKPYDLVVYAADSKKKDVNNAVLWRPYGQKLQAVAPNELHIDLKKTTVIFKMHGSIFRSNDKEPDSRTAEELDSFVITEEDYVEFLARMTNNRAIPPIFIPYFTNRCFLFLGYSLRDWNLRVVLRNISKFLKDRTDEDDLPSWAIQSGVSELDRRLWSKRGVDIYDVKVDDFIEEIERCR